MSISSQPVRAKSLKRFAFLVLTSRVSRWLVGAILGDTVPFRGTRIRTSRRGSFEAPLLLAGIYERAEIDFVHRYLPRNQRVIELGSSIGGNSCQISRRLAPGVGMTCVEANPEIITVLRDNIARNCSGRPVEVVHAMIGDSVGVAELAIGGSTLDSGAGRSGVRTAQVPTLTLRELVARQGGESFSVVSDIEGAEVAMLLRHRDALSSCNLMILECHAVEFEGRRYTLEEVLALPMADGSWEMIDRHHAVAVYRRKQA